MKSNNKTKTTWNIIKIITNNKDTIDNTLTMNKNEKMLNNPLIIANAFNTYFSSVVENLLQKNFQGKNIFNSKDAISYLQQNFCQFSSTMKLGNTTPFEIEKIINSLKKNNSYGYDEISTRILKVSTPYILATLTYIFNKIFSQGVFPDRLKYSEVKPLYKKGVNTDLSKYRPISLLTSFSKIIEKIIYKRMYNYLINNNILVNDQFGFREKLSTEMATYTLINNVLSSLDKKFLVGGIFCDLQKAFNCVNHGILLAKMSFYGITGIGNKLMKSYLENM